VFFRTARAACVLLAALAAASCSRKAPAETERLAILRFENLSPGTAPDWMGRAFSEVITAELSGPTGLYAIPTSRLHQLNAAMGARPVAAPGISAEAPLAIAAGANRLGYGDYSVIGGRLHARLTIDNPGRRQAARSPIEVSIEAGDVVGAATALAKAISAQAQPYGTSNERALEAYTTAMEAPDAGSIAAGAQQAIAADPNFASAYALLAEMRAKQQDRAGALALLQAAMAREGSLQPFERVRIAMLDASLRGDAKLLEKALGLFLKTSPLDPAAWRAAAQFEVTRHKYPEASQAYERALAIEPEDGTSWNELGYTAAYAGNFDLARSAIGHYRALRPADPNPLDTIGDIEFLAGRFAEAERWYLEANQKSPEFLGGADVYKAAMAHLMTGDVAGADAVAKKSEALASSAEWLWLSGRREQAFAKLSSDAAALAGRDAQSRAYTQLTIWAMSLGKRDAAARFSQQAAATATPATGAIVAVARFLALPSASPEEWSSRASQMFPNAPPGSVKDYALAYALLFDGHFAAAVPVLTQLDARIPANGDRSAAIELAWALVQSGKPQDAAPLLKLNPVPNFGATAVFVPLYFPRIFQLRAAVGENAAENRRMYAALGGK
jgi:tetratricopeptide (TPR) repeat protein